MACASLAPPMADVIPQYTRMLRRSDEISWAALMLGMRMYRPDAEKAAHYTAQRATHG